MTLPLPESDEALAARARDGERAAFDALVRRHKDGLFAFVRRYMGSAEEGYDVLQESFVSAWLALRRYDPERPFLPWLRTIALNKCRDSARRQKVRRLVMRAFLLEQPDIEPTTARQDQAREDEAALADRLARLDRAIAALPGLYKEPLLLTTVSGLSHKEAAEVLKTTPKAIEMRLARARQRLQAMLAQG
ncbi:RNA polymerase sigma-70 factor, ECF subfamily [Enhydrobacter aerosaccus]|uniref:RNA polymerase sigma-70 factor, ECF subfamily n=1 Tax=Enhydrobacter aerosaccus TaxID=225324 RepID=A0A1T4JNL1_9HYPH|nr:RNA polymerase sigma factor [Enhydrobacter aerosaccus]SJZ31753.1 RNA polymerase sigma-70 factor, ECF subfamily [Enhydrobacter aerosaccus]